MIDVSEVLNAMPSFTKFCSVDELTKLAESLASSEFDVNVVGRSASGRPVHHVRFGKGRRKALFVGFPHPNEPIGGMTAFSILTLLRQRHDQLVNADVEWHVIPCADPDGALLNEGWSQKEFVLREYMRQVHRQEPCDQVERSFPITYKKVKFDKPIVETKILQGVFASVKPDFYHSLHNAYAGGALYMLNRDIPRKYYPRLHRLLVDHGIPIQASAAFGGVFERYSEGVEELFTVRKYYDYLETTTSSPEDGMHNAGSCSWEYLAGINRDCLSFAAELPYLRHPASDSNRLTQRNLRQAKLRVDADNKFLVTVVLEEWDKVAKDLDTSSPFYRKIFNCVVANRHRLHEGLPSWEVGTRDILFSRAYSHEMTESEQLYVYMYDRFYVLCSCYEFVRLLKSSKPTPDALRSIERLEALFDEGFDDISRNIDIGKFEVIDCTTLAKVQLGSGLTVLNSLLEPTLS